jgi:hypothetical protein
VFRNPGGVKKSGSGMNNPDHISESLETIFWVKILKFFDADLGWNKIRIRYPGWKKFGSGINIPVNTAFVFDYRTPHRDLFFVYCTPSYLRTGDSNLDVGKASPGLSVSCAAQVPQGLRLVLWSTLLCCGE